MGGDAAYSWPCPQTSAALARPDSNLPPPLPSPKQLRGAFAFIAYDRLHGRIVAARDSGGGEPLWWGTAMLSEGLLFASSR